MTYTHGHADAVLRSHRWRTAENSCAYLLPHLRPAMRLLDVGCGPGNITTDLARIVAPGPVTGIDAAEDVLGEARERAARDGVENVVFLRGDVYGLEFDDATFDVVHAHQVLQHLADPVAALREMGRVCTPGGIVAVRDGDYSSFAWHPEDPQLTQWLQLYRDVAVANGGDPDAGRRLKAWARAAGIGEVVSSASVWCYSTDEEREWWASLWAERTTSTRLADRAVELGLATPADLQQMAESWQRWAADPDGWFSVPHGEIVVRRG